MMESPQRKRLARLVPGFLLLLLGGGAADVWFRRVAPFMRTQDPEWCSAHSDEAYWIEAQKAIHRGMWVHDTGFIVGRYGDKRWAEWIMARVKPGQDMGCSSEGLCHSANAMRDITNHDAGPSANDWLGWWESNKSKSQAEWIAAGFRQRGFNVEVPPKPGEFPILLAILGNTATNKSEAIPGWMKYNAFRCLRDSGFEPVGFALSNRQVSAEVAVGLLAYAERNRRALEASAVGTLPFAVKAPENDELARPISLRRSFRVAVHALIFGPLAVGAWLVGRSAGERRRSAGLD